MRDNKGVGFKNEKKQEIEQGNEQTFFTDCCDVGSAGKPVNLNCAHL